MSDKLNKRFEISEVEEQELITVSPEDGEDTEVDYNYTRLNMYDLIEKGNKAIEGALEIALENGHPRAYEVLSSLNKNVGETNEKLMDLHKTVNDLKPVTVPTQVTNNNSLFVGSTKELQKMLKGK